MKIGELKMIIRRISLLLMLLIPTALAAQTAAFNGYCTQGSVSSTTSGLPSSNKLQGLIPQCQVEVFLTRTTTIATIYSDSSSTPLTNPFTADQKAKWLFWAATGQGYDVVMSGGIPPLTYAAPVSLTDLIVGSTTGTGVVVEVNGTAISPASPANFADTATVTWAFVGGQIEATAVGGGTSTCGSITGDNTSTDCGYQNRTPDTATTPASNSTFGYQNLDHNSATTTSTFGTLNGAYTTGQENFLGGDSNGVGTASGNCTLQWSSLIGDHNLNGSTGGDCAGSSLDQVVTLGSYNLNYLATPASSSFQDVVIGFYNLNTDMVGQTLQNPGINNSVVIGNTAARGISGNDVIAIGDSAMDNHAAAAVNDIESVIAIGQTAASGIAPNERGGIFIGVGAGGGNPSFANGTYGAGQEQACVGENACTGSTGINTIGIGVAAVGGIGIVTGTVLAHNTGTDVYGIGFDALRANTTGSHNIAIGDNAGCVGCTTDAGTVAFGNQTGSHNVWIGDNSGPASATQMSNTVAIGASAQNTASNQIMLGTTTMTDFEVPGIAAASVTSCLQIDTSGKITNTAASCSSGLTGTGTAGVLAAWTGAAALGNSPLDTTTNPGSVTSSQAIIAPGFTANGTSAGYIQLGAGTALGAAPTSTVQIYAPAAVTAYSLVLPAAAPTAGNTFLSCTAATPSVCTFAAGGGGTTTNALTGAASGGAAPGTTFDGSVARTFDYHTFGAAGLAASNTFSGATTNDFSGTSQFKLPVAAGYASLAQGEIGYDSTNLNWHTWANGADNFVAVFPVASPPTSGNCVQWVKTGNSWSLGQAGGACGTASATAVTVNGSATLGTANLNDTTPTAGTGYANGKWQVSGSNVSVETIVSTGAYWQIPAGTLTSTTEPILYMGHAGALRVCTVGITATDAVNPVTFDIKQNGTSILSGGAQTIAASTTGYVDYTLTSTPLAVAEHDAMTISFSAIGSSWAFAANCHNP
jgi:hypothetical protein